MSISNFKTLICLLLPIALISGLAYPAKAADFKKEVVYQIFTDRFFNGSAANDDPTKSPGMFDSSKTNWGAYWGGDLQGIRQKLDYIQGIGATAVWISPVIDNINKVVLDGKGKVQAPYHGYHARDFKRIEEHFGDADTSWKEFDLLVEEAHKRGMKVVIDLPLNHTSEYNHGEFGAFWDDGHYKGDTENDRSKYFNHLPLVSDYNNRYQLQYYTIFYLGDLNQENEFVDRYLKAAAERFLEHGADATRLDAAKHANWGWQQSLTNDLYNKKHHFVVAEWWLNDTAEPLFKDAVKFVNKGGMSMMDFPLANAIRSVLGAKTSGDFKVIDKVIEEEYSVFDDANGLVTFIDNHDMPRFLSLNDNKESLHLALALLFTLRGTPIVYYGTEQYLHNDTNGGGDPYTRAWMTSFDEKVPGYQLVKKLASVRKSNDAFAYGQQKTIHVSSDCYVYQRKFGDNVAVVAINKDQSKAAHLKVALPLKPGEHKDALSAELRGTDLNVTSSTEVELTLPPGSTSVWCEKCENSQPIIGSVAPQVINGGAPVTISGAGFGIDRGQLQIGKEKVDISSWTDNTIEFIAPHLSRGSEKVTVITSGGKESNQSSLAFVEGKLIPIRLTVKNMKLKDGEQLFISGDVFMLGNNSKDWSSAAGPMLFSEDQDYILVVPMPAGQSVNMKLMVLDKNGKVVREESNSHKYKVPKLGVWNHEIAWQD